MVMIEWFFVRCRIRGLGNCCTESGNAELCSVGRISLVSDVDVDIDLWGIRGLGAMYRVGRYLGTWYGDSWADRRA